MSDLIDRQVAIDALWKALYEYEDKTEKQFKESDELDVGDWILHRVFVQNMSDIDRRAILDLPSAQPQRENQKTALSVQVKVDFDDMKVLLEDIGKLQTYKLFVGDDMVLVDVEDIKDILAKHVKAKEVQSQRNTGKWINHRNDDGHNIADCPICGNAIQWFDGDEIPRYCCMCGADMRGESDETICD